MNRVTAISYANYYFIQPLGEYHALVIHPIHRKTALERLALKISAIVLIPIAYPCLGVANLVGRVVCYCIGAKALQKTASDPQKTTPDPQKTAVDLMAQNHTQSQSIPNIPVSITTSDPGIVLTV